MGGGSKKFGNLGGRGRGSKNVAIHVGGGVDFFWNNPRAGGRGRCRLVFHPVVSSPVMLFFFFFSEIVIESTTKIKHIYYIYVYKHGSKELEDRLCKTVPRFYC